MQCIGRGSSRRAKGREAAANAKEESEMRYQLIGSGWPVNQWLVPLGYIYDDKVKDEWSDLVKGRTPPLNAVALDSEAANAMWTAYPLHRHLIVTGPGVQRR